MAQTKKKPSQPKRPSNRGTTRARIASKGRVGRGLGFKNRIQPI